MDAGAGTQLHVTDAKTSPECWLSRSLTGSGSVANSRAEGGQAMVKSAKAETQERGAHGSIVTVYLDVDHRNENSRKCSEEEEERELDEPEDEEDGVHGGRMKPLASFDVNRPSQRRRFRFRNSPTGEDGRFNKAAGFKPPRRPRDKVNSSSAPRLTILNDCKENNGGLVPLCPGKTHIRGMEPENCGLKASSHTGISRTIGKKRSRLKTKDGENEHDIKVTLGSTDRWQRGGMDLLLMVLDSGLVEAEGHQQTQGATDLCVRSELIESVSNGNRSQFSTGNVPEIQKFPKKPSCKQMILPCIPKSTEKLTEWAYQEIQPNNDEEDSEDTAEDPNISSRKHPIRVRKSMNPPNCVHPNADFFIQSESSPRACQQISKVALSPKIRYLKEVGEGQTCAEEAKRWSNSGDEFAVEPELDLEPSLRIAGDMRTTAFSRVLQHENSVSDYAEKRKSVCLDTTTNLLSNSNLLIDRHSNGNLEPSEGQLTENINQAQEEKDIHRRENSSSLKVFHEPSLIIAHDMRPSLIQPVKIVGRLHQFMGTKSEQKMGASPMEVDVGLEGDVSLSGRTEESQAHEYTRYDTTLQMWKSKKRKTTDRISAFRAVRMATDEHKPGTAISNSSGSAFRKFEDQVHCQNRGTNQNRIKIQDGNFQPCGDAWRGRTENLCVQAQAGLQQKVRPLHSPTTCRNGESRLPCTLGPSQHTHGEDEKLALSLSSMSGQEMPNSMLDRKRADGTFDATPALIEEVAVAQFEGPVDTVPDLVTVIRVADSHREISSTVLHTLQPETQVSLPRYTSVQTSVATGFHISDSQAKVSSPFGKRRRRNVPLVASHFQDSQQAKTIVSNPWFKSGESLGQCAVQVSASASTAGGSYSVDVVRKGRRRIGPRKSQVGRPRTRILAPNLGNLSNFMDSNSALGNRSGMVRPGPTYHNMANSFSQGGTDVKIRQRRGQKKAQEESLKIKRGMSMAGKFKRLSEPSGFLGEFNPGIIQRVRNTHQIHAILGALVGVEPSKVANNMSICKDEPEVSLEDPNFGPQAARDGDANVGSINTKPHHDSGLTSVEKGEIVGTGGPDEDPNRFSSVQGPSIGAECQRENFALLYRAPHDNPQGTEGLLRATRTPEVKPLHCSVPDDLQPSNSFKCIETSFAQGENHQQSDYLYTSNSEHPDVHLHESTVDPNEERRARTFTQFPAPAPPEAAGLAAQWLELLTLDIKGRLSALKRSRRRVRTLLVSGQLGNAKAPPVDHPGGEESRVGEPRKASSDPVHCVTWPTEQERLESQVDKWRALFTNMDGVLCLEAAKLESNLWQIQQMVLLCQDPKHLHATAGPALPIMPDLSVGKENCPPLRWPFPTEIMVPEVPMAASAASILSTANPRL